MAAAVSSVPRLTFFDNVGAPLDGGLVYTYVAWTLSAKTTYSDESKTVPISNPIVLNSAGRPVASATDPTEVNVYYSGSAKFVVKTSGGSTLYTADNVEEVAAQATIATQTGLTYVSPTINTSILSASALLAGICGGRLTLTSGTPVTTGDVTAAMSIYFAPYGTGVGTGNIGLYDGSATWTLLPFTEKSLALGTLTSGLPYDVFAYNNGGVVALRTPVAWTSTTVRATALTTQNGILVKTGATTDRYLGTFYTTSTTTTEDSVTKRYLWNYYNRVRRPLERYESTASWQYTTATVRQANGASANQVAVVIGVAEVTVDLSLNLAAVNSTPANVSVGIGEDSTTTYARGGYLQTASPTPISVRLVKEPTIGQHFYAWNEWSTASGTTTFSGATSGVGSTITSGLEGWIEG